jgi:hypothetical protein
MKLSDWGFKWAVFKVRLWEIQSGSDVEWLSQSLVAPPARPQMEAEPHNPKPHRQEG